jgi:hypothetical protein
MSRRLRCARTSKACPKATHSGPRVTRTRPYPVPLRPVLTRSGSLSPHPRPSRPTPPDLRGLLAMTLPAPSHETRRTVPLPPSAHELQRPVPSPPEDLSPRAADPLPAPSHETRRTVPSPPSSHELRRPVPSHVEDLSPRPADPRDLSPRTGVSPRTGGPHARAVPTQRAGLRRFTKACPRVTGLRGPVPSPRRPFERREA